MSITKRPATAFTIFLTLYGIIVLISLDAQAATYTVTTTLDRRAGSLRAAVAIANLTSENDTIDFQIPEDDPNCTTEGMCYLILSLNEIAVNSAATAGSLTITNAAGPGNLLISGNNTNRAFFVKSGGELTLEGITITNGYAKGATAPYEDGIGGGIYSLGVLTLINSIINNNVGGHGGGIFSRGTLTVTNSIVRDNFSAQEGGGISSIGTVTLTNSVINSNVAKSTGGGLLVNGGQAAVVNSIISDNSAQSGSGGGINCDAPATLRLTNSAIRNNAATVAGGIRCSGTLTLFNSTVNKNRAQFVGGISSDGRLTLTDSTVNDNMSQNGNGGGISCSGISSLINSIVNNNSAPGGGGIFNSFGNTLSLTNTIISNNNAQSGNGGGILNYGTSTLTSSTINGNMAQNEGGGIYNSGIFNNDTTNGGVLTVNNSYVNGNSGQANGGGISNIRGFVTIINSTLNDNKALGAGGGIINGFDGAVTLTKSLVNGNTANSGAVFNFGSIMTLAASTVSNNIGGGISNTATLILTDSTISGNVSEFGAGGVFNNPSSEMNNVTATLINSTISGNSARYYGGFYIADSTTLNLTNVTVTLNRSTFSNCLGCAGGIFAAGTVNLNNTIVAGNINANASLSPDFNGLVSANSAYNIIGNNLGLIGISDGVNGNQIGTPASPINARLLPLANNGGATQTHAVLFDSPAIDKGRSFGSATDQRGFTRPFDLPTYPNATSGDGADIGAFEAQFSNMDEDASRLSLLRNDY